MEEQLSSTMDQVKRLRALADTEAAAAIVGVVFAVIQHEIAKSEAGLRLPCNPDVVAGCDPRDSAAFWPPPPTASFQAEACRVVGSVLTAIAVLACGAYYQALLREKQAKNLLPASATLLGSRLAIPFAVEVLALLVHPFPLILSLQLDSPGLYLAFLLIPLLRLLLLLRVVRYHSPLNTSNGRFIGALTNVEFDSSFIVKTVLKERPVVVLLLSLAAILAASSYAIHVIESVECAFYRDMGCPPLSFSDAVWLVVITGLTVGYGDVVAATVGGRVVTVVGGLLGTLLTAVTIALTTEYLQLTRSESKVVTFLAKHRQRQRLQAAAADVIQVFWRWRAMYRAGARALDTAPLRLRGARSSDAEQPASVVVTMPKDPSKGAWLVTHRQAQPTDVAPTNRDDDSNNNNNDDDDEQDDGSRSVQDGKDASSLDAARPATKPSAQEARSNGAAAPSKRSGAAAGKDDEGEGASSSCGGPWRWRREVRRLEAEAYARIGHFRVTRRHVRGADPTDPTDKQLTLLEGIDAEMTVLRDDVDSVKDAFVQALGRVRQVVEKAVASSRSHKGSRASSRQDVRSRRAAQRHQHGRKLPTPQSPGMGSDHLQASPRLPPLARSLTGTSKESHDSGMRSQPSDTASHGSQRHEQHPTATEGRRAGSKRRASLVGDLTTQGHGMSKQSTEAIVSRLGVAAVALPGEESSRAAPAATDSKAAAVAGTPAQSGDPQNADDEAISHRRRSTGRRKASIAAVARNAVPFGNDVLTATSPDPGHRGVFAEDGSNDDDAPPLALALPAGNSLTGPLRELEHAAEGTTATLREERLAKLTPFERNLAQLQLQQREEDSKRGVVLSPANSATSRPVTASSGSSHRPPSPRLAETPSGTSLASIMTAVATLTESLARLESAVFTRLDEQDTRLSRIEAEMAAPKPPQPVYSTSQAESDGELAPHQGRSTASASSKDGSASSEAVNGDDASQDVAENELPALTAALDSATSAVHDARAAARHAEAAAAKAATAATAAEEAKVHAQRSEAASEANASSSRQSAKAAEEAAAAAKEARGAAEALTAGMDRDQQAVRAAVQSVSRYRDEAVTAAAEATEAAEAVNAAAGALRPTTAAAKAKATEEEAMEAAPDDEQEQEQVTFSSSAGMTAETPSRPLPPLQRPALNGEASGHAAASQAVTMRPMRRIASKPRGMRSRGGAKTKKKPKGT